MRVLVVTSPFGGHEVGSRITDPKQIEEILKGEQAHRVVQADHEMPQAANKAEIGGDETHEDAKE